MTHTDLDLAIIPPAKLRDYLLSPLHPIGRYKSAFFLDLGYSQESWQVLERDLRAVLRGEVKVLDVTEFGQKLAARGQLRGPTGRAAGVVAIWIVLTGESTPRFVTAYPED